MHENLENSDMFKMPESVSESNQRRKEITLSLFFSFANNKTSRIYTWTEAISVGINFLSEDICKTNRFFYKYIHMQSKIYSINFLFL